MAESDRPVFQNVSQPSNQLQHERICSPFELHHHQINQPHEQQNPIQRNLYSEHPQRQDHQQTIVHSGKPVLPAYGPFASADMERQQYYSMHQSQINNQRHQIIQQSNTMLLPGFDILHDQRTVSNQRSNLVFPTVERRKRGLNKNKGLPKVPKPNKEGLKNSQAQTNSETHTTPGLSSSNMEVKSVAASENKSTSYNGDFFDGTDSRPLCEQLDEFVNDIWPSLTPLDPSVDWQFLDIVNSTNETIENNTEDEIDALINSISDFDDIFTTTTSEVNGLKNNCTSSLEPRTMKQCRTEHGNTADIIVDNESRMNNTPLLDVHHKLEFPKTEQEPIPLSVPNSNHSPASIDSGVVIEFSNSSSCYPVPPRSHSTSEISSTSTSPASISNSPVICPPITMIKHQYQRSPYVSPISNASPGLLINIDSNIVNTRPGHPLLNPNSSVLGNNLKCSINKNNPLHEIHEELFQIQQQLQPTGQRSVPVNNIISSYNQRIHQPIGQLESMGQPTIRQSDMYQTSSISANWPNTDFLLGQNNNINQNASTSYEASQKNKLEMEKNEISDRKFLKRGFIESLEIEQPPFQQTRAETQIIPNQSAIRVQQSKNSRCDTPFVINEVGVQPTFDQLILSQKQQEMLRKSQMSQSQQMVRSLEMKQNKTVQQQRKFLQFQKQQLTRTQQQQHHLVGFREQKLIRSQQLQVLELMQSQQQQLVEFQKQQMLRAQQQQISVSPQHQQVMGPRPQQVMRSQQVTLSHPQQHVLRQQYQEVMLSPQNQLSSRHAEGMVSPLQRGMVSPQQQLMGSLQQQMMESHQQQVMVSQKAMGSQQVIETQSSHITVSLQQQMRSSPHQLTTRYQQKEIMVSPQQQVLLSQQQQPMIWPQQILMPPKYQGINSQQQRVINSQRQQQQLMSSQQQALDFQQTADLSKNTIQQQFATEEQHQQTKF